MTFRPLPTRNEAIVMCAFVAITVLACAGLLSAAALVPAPLGALPVIVIACIGVPMVAAWELRPSIAVLRAHGTRRSHEARALADMRRFLAGLPETRHPLDL